MQLILSCSPYGDSNVMQERNHADIKETNGPVLAISFNKMFPQKFPNFRLQNMLQSVNLIIYP